MDQVYGGGGEIFMWWIKFMEEVVEEQEEEEQEEQEEQEQEEQEQEWGRWEKIVRSDI